MGVLRCPGHNRMSRAGLGADLRDNESASPPCPPLASLEARGVFLPSQEPVGDCAPSPPGSDPGTLLPNPLLACRCRGRWRQTPPISSVLRRVGPLQPSDPEEAFAAWSFCKNSYVVIVLRTQTYQRRGVPGAGGRAATRKLHLGDSGPGALESILFLP